MTKGLIIVLNGVSSSGKSSLAKELVKELTDFYHLSIDDFDSVIDKMEDRAGERLIPVPTEYFFHRTIQMFSDKGINLVVDQILHDSETIFDFEEALRGYPVVFVGVHCSLRELEKREQSRGDRRSGLAKSQLEFVHQQKENYTLEVDTSVDTLSACVEQILNVIKSRRLSSTQ